MRLSVSQEDIVERDTDTDMFQDRCPNCGCAEEAAAELPGRVQMRLLRTVRVIAVSMVLLLGMFLAVLVLLLFGSPTALRQSKESESQTNLPEARSEKLQSDQDLLHPSALLTITNLKSVSTPEWQHAQGNAHIGGHLTVSNENLSVPTKGLYRLYLQITFAFDDDNQNCHDICEGDLMSLEISVRRFTNSYKSFRTLLQSKDTMSCSHSWTKTMTTAGTFELEANTLLQVQLEHITLVNDQDTLSFFGVELVALK